MCTENFCSVEDPKIPSELAYHIADIYLEELNRAIASKSDAEPVPAPLCVLSKPIFSQLARTPNTTTFKRMQTAFLEPLVHALSEKATSDDEDEGDGQPSQKRPRLDTYDDLVAHACVDAIDEGIVTKSSLRRAILKRIFSLASEESTRDANRRKLYAFVKNYDDDDEGDS